LLLDKYSLCTDIGEVTRLGAQLSLHLLGPFRARRGENPVPLPRSAARVLVYLAVHAAASRQQVAGSLWPDVPQPRANSDLRTALWRLHRAADEFLLVSGETLAIAEPVVVDLQQVIDWATRTVAGSGDLPPPRGSGRELLPGWDEEWLEDPRERIRMLTVQAFESIAERLLTAGRPAEALPYLLQVTEIDPLRESAQQLMVELHLRQRNVHEALRQYRRYERLVRRDLGIEPGVGLRSLLSRYAPNLVD
jgi:DNA-binding SARP family transcriptional activator